MATAPLTQVEAGTLYGRFKNTETRVQFEYGDAPDRPFGPEYCCAVYLRDGAFRYAKVLRTVAYVVVDEAEDGSPVTERWEIRAHKEY